MSIPPYCLLCTARSGSTALARILDQAENGHCAAEPAPNFNYETRLAMDGRLDAVARKDLIQSTLVPRVHEGQEKYGIYGEKHVTYGPFIAEISQELKARFIHLIRDGREVVRSMIDWHNAKFGTVYRECTDAGTLSPEAIFAASNLLACDDMSDYSRCRPCTMDEIYTRWSEFSRAQMCSWYWTRTHEIYLDALSRLPEDQWRRVDLNKHEQIHDLFPFLSLSSPPESVLTEMLSSRINSLEDRQTPNIAPYPSWEFWDSEERDAFEELAGSMMTRLGYWESHATRWRPVQFGQVWQDKGGDLDWYEWMYNGRRQVHEDLLGWIQEHPEIRSCVDLGCGMGVGYREAFSDRRYMGVDLSTTNIEWCNNNNDNLLHSYVAEDFMVSNPSQLFDLAYSQGTIDNCYDMDGYLEAVVRWSKSRIYVTCYRGWFPNLQEHQYTWNPDHSCFYNDLSPTRARKTLEDIGCTNIEITPVPTGNDDIPYETRIVARVPVKS